MKTRKLDIEIRATLSAIQPLSFTLPDVGFPIMTRMTATGEEKTAYIPATTIRGRLRRCAWNEVAEALAAAGKPASLDAFYMSAIGQTRQSEQEQEKVELLKIEAARAENPIASLFGSGLGLASKLQVSMAVPSVAVQPQEIRGVRKDISSEELGALAENAVDDWVERATANSARSKASTKAVKLSRDIYKLKQKGGDVEKIAALEGSLQKEHDAEAAAAEEAGSGVSTLMPIGYQAIPAGTDFHLTMRARSATVTEVGILLRALDLFSLNPMLGAQTARGCGEVAMQCSFRVRDAGADHWTEAGTIKVGGFERAGINAQNPIVEEALGAQREMIGEVTNYSWAPKETKNAPKRAA
jgi:CRISPR type IV-associated protein Csf2